MILFKISGNHFKITHYIAHLVPVEYPGFDPNISDLNIILIIPCAANPLMFGTPDSPISWISGLSGAPLFD